MSEWQPIETAPKGKFHSIECDSHAGKYCSCEQPLKIVMVYGPAGLRFGKQDQNGQWRNMMNRPMNVKPTHWMPLPEPPK